RPFRPPAAGGVRGASARRGAVPDRLPHGGPAAGVGGGDADPPAPGAARTPARPPSARARDRGAARAAVVGRLAPAHRGRGLRPALAGRARGRTRPGGGRLTWNRSASR